MIYVLMADGCGEIAAVTPVDLMRRYDIEVKTVAVSGPVITTARNMKMIPDISIDEANADEVDLLYLPGAFPGVYNLRDSEKVQDLIKKVWEKGAYVSGICAAPPIVLGKTGILKGRHATCFPGCEKDLDELGAIRESSQVVVDGKLITGRNASAAFELTAAMCRAVGNETAAKDVVDMGRICVNAGPK